MPGDPQAGPCDFLAIDQECEGQTFGPAKRHARFEREHARQVLVREVAERAGDFYTCRRHHAAGRSPFFVTDIDAHLERPIGVARRDRKFDRQEEPVFRREGRHHQAVPPGTEDEQFAVVNLRGVAENEALGAYPRAEERAQGHRVVSFGGHGCSLDALTPDPANARSADGEGSQDCDSVVVAVQSKTTPTYSSLRCARPAYAA